MASIKWYHVYFGTATFGIMVDGDTVKDAPPIARWTIGKKWDKVKKWYDKKGARVYAI